MASEQSTLKTVSMYGFAVLVIAGLVVYMIFAPPNVQLDPKTLCPRDSAKVLSRTTVVILDRTDPITEVQQQDIVATLSGIFSKASPHERFVIYLLDARKDIVLDGLVRCNPLGPKQDGAIEKLGTEEELGAKFFKDKFLDPLVAKVAAVLPTATTTQTDSPIMEMIQAVAVRDLKRSPRATLILVSDLMQHSARYTQYKGVLDFDAFVRSAAFKEVAIDLSNTNVRVLYITRTRGPSRQPSGHEDFWKQYFSVLKANLYISQTVRGEGWK